MATPVFLYHLTLKEPTLVTKCVYGSFSAEKKHELVVAKGSVLELLSVEEPGKVTSLGSVREFCVGLLFLFFFFFFFCFFVFVWFF